MSDWEQEYERRRLERERARLEREERRRREEEVRIKRQFLFHLLTQSVLVVLRYLRVNTAFYIKEFQWECICCSQNDEQSLTVFNAKLSVFLSFPFPFAFIIIFLFTSLPP